MKTIAIIARLLLGLALTVFGLNGFQHFIPMGPMPTGHAAEFTRVLSETHYFSFIMGVQLVCGLLLLANLFVPMALVVIAPVIVNILLFHLTMAREEIVPGLIVAALWVVVAFRYRAAIFRTVPGQSPLIFTAKVGHRVCVFCWA